MRRRDDLSCHRGRGQGNDLRAAVLERGNEGPVSST